jgi:adenylate cyclase
MKLCVDAIRDCLEGVIPSTVATCAADGTPNVSYASQVHYVDGEHVALTFQFFNKTHANVLVNPRAVVQVVNPWTGAQFRLAVEFLRTETSGALFESMKAKLAGIASHTGMTGVFRLLGSDVYRVLDIERVPGREVAPPAGRRSLLAALRATTERIAECADFAGLVDAALASLETQFGVDHAMILMLEQPAGRLYTVASRGYASSGVGSEIPLGQGVVGVAAREGTPIRISHMTADYSYSRAIRQEAAQTGMAGVLETEIPLPGLAESRSQLAVPIVACRRVIGVLYVESPEEQRFRYDDEDALVAVAGQLGAAMHILQAVEAEADTAGPASRPAPAHGPAVAVRHYAENDSVFLGEDYLIKGVAGAILWKLARDFVREGRTDFTNRELRLDPSIRLPDISDNLEARLVLLQRRLAERGGILHIEKTGRGRFRLVVDRPIELVDVPA